MRKQKRILALALAATLLLAGCTKGEASVTPSSTEPVSVSEEAKASTETSASKEEASVSTETSESTEASVSTETSASTEEKDFTVRPDNLVNVLVSKHKAPESEALKFTESMGAGYNLGNTFDANDSKNVFSDDLQFETYWQNVKTTKQHILDLKEAGFKTIRIPVSWHNHVDADYNINEKWMDRVYEVVNWALEEDMYVIINIHHDNLKKYMYPSYDCLDNSKKYVSKVWEQIATKFGDCDEKLVFESLNEPRLVGTDIEWNIPDLNSKQAQEALDCVNQLNQLIVDTIRQTPGAYNKTRYITVPGYCASPDYILCDAFKMPADDYAEAENRILLTVHAYRPYLFALAEPNVSGATATFDQSGAVSELNALFMNLFVKYIKNGTGIIIDEFGARDRNGNTEDRARYAATFTAYARSYLMPVCWWDNNNFSGSGEIFGIYKRADNSFPYPDIVSQLVWYGNN